MVRIYAHGRECMFVCGQDKSKIVCRKNLRIRHTLIILFPCYEEPQKEENKIGLSKKSVD